MPIPRLSYPQVTPNWIEGQVINAPLGGVITLPLAATDAARSCTITPGVATQEVTVYRLRENLTGQLVTFTSDSSPTAAEVVTGLKAAVQANAILNGMVTLSGTTTLILTSRQKGSAGPLFDFVDGGSTPTNVLTAVTTAATDTPLVPYGRAVTTPSTAPSAARLIAATLGSTNLLRGFACHTHFDVSDQVVSSDGYPARSALNVLRKGSIALKSVTAFTPLSAVWLLFSGANAGLLRTSDSGNSDNIQITNGIEFRGTGGAGDIGEVFVDLDALTTA